MKNISSKLIVEGVNRKGELFRPTDWAQRLSSFGAEFGDDHRLHFSPLLHPNMNNDIICLVVDPLLAEQNPSVYEHVMKFVEVNDLVTHYDEVA